MIRAVLFDVLGTLVELLPPAPRLRQALGARGIEVTESEARAAFGAEISYYLANHMDGGTQAGLEDLRDRCAGEIRAVLGLPGARQADVRAAMLEALGFAAFEDAAPALRELRAGGVRCVAASNWDCSLPEALARAGLDGLLDGAASSAVAGAAKPAPAVFRAALALARCEPAEALFVGDSVENDIKGAEAVGMRAVLVQREGEPPAGVTALRSLAELPDHVASLT